VTEGIALPEKRRIWLTKIPAMEADSSLVTVRVLEGEWSSAD